MKKHVVVVGAGPGGLTAAMILAHRGYQVTVLEKQASVGGRNAALRMNGYTFDLGPTFLMMRSILDEVFELAGRKSEDLLSFKYLDPMYRLDFRDVKIDVTTDHQQLKAQIEKFFPGESAGIAEFMRRERVRYEKMAPCLQKDYSNFSAMYSKEMRNALPHLSLTKSLYENLGRYFRSDRLRTCFTFQAKYLGMSPWNCPAAFTIIPYIEHAFGVWHVQGGLSAISDMMAKVLVDQGGRIFCDTPVRQILTKNRTATGVELENGEKLSADAVVINADFAHAMTTLFPPGLLRKHTPERLKRKEFSCSTFMLYLGLDKTYDDAHHSIYFARDYRKNIEDIAVHKRVSEDSSFYVRNASITDPTLAPPGHSALYVLVPVPNNTSGIDWTENAIDMRNRVLRQIKERTSMTDIERHIVAERVITPSDWQKDGVFLGATFNLAHSLGQMLYFRPHNRFEELDRCFLVGGGTHPGSGLPTIYESGRISANLITNLFAS